MPATQTTNTSYLITPSASPVEIGVTYLGETVSIKLGPGDHSRAFEYAKEQHLQKKLEKMQAEIDTLKKLVEQLNSRNMRF